MSGDMSKLMEFAKKRQNSNDFAGRMIGLTRDAVQLGLALSGQALLKEYNIIKIYNIKNILTILPEHYAL
jgi:hypothetical protein